MNTVNNSGQFINIAYNNLTQNAYIVRNNLLQTFKADLYSELYAYEVVIVGFEISGNYVGLLDKLKESKLEVRCKIAQLNYKMNLVYENNPELVPDQVKREQHIRGIEKEKYQAISNYLDSVLGEVRYILQNL